MIVIVVIAVMCLSRQYCFQYYYCFYDCYSCVIVNSAWLLVVLLLLFLLFL